MIRQAAIGFLVFSVGAMANDIPNPLIDYAAFQSDVIEVGELRNDRRITEEQFISMARKPGTVILDARSRLMFDLLHVRGAKNLSLPDMTEAELRKVIPSKATPVLIYCNNNFLNEPGAFPTKAVNASLNLYTFNALHAYGYTNVYELGPLIDVKNTKLALVRRETAN